MDKLYSCKEGTEGETNIPFQSDIQILSPHALSRQNKATTRYNKHYKPTYTYSNKITSTSKMYIIWTVHFTYSTYVENLTLQQWYDALKIPFGPTFR